MDKLELAKMMDATLLNPNATYDQIASLCSDAAANSVWSVCVNPVHVKRACQHLSGTDLKVCAVVGFPLGANRTETKVAEATRALEDGADEVDMVMNVGAFLSGDSKTAEEDIVAIVRAAGGKIVKVIIEITLLDDHTIVQAARLVSNAGAHFVKTQTGWAQTRDTTAQDIRLIKSAIAPQVKIKASGGTRNWKAVSCLLEAGASRFGVRIQDVSQILADMEGVQHGG